MSVPVEETRFHRRRSFAVFIMVRRPRTLVVSRRECSMMRKAIVYRVVLARLPELDRQTVPGVVGSVSSP